ncbi:hypothetical protein SMRU11_05730 (plasmid) [Sinorhizobium meliloti RU11/001]|nr:hypothetical protein SMRU11_05730 [Sinorhizobium meliloti RU11/001]
MITCDRSSGARAGRPLTAQTGEDSNGTFGEYCSGIHTGGAIISEQRGGFIGIGMERPISSMKTRRAGSRSSCASNQS